MKLPNNFKSTIKKTFYDKEIDLYDVDETVDEEGFSTKGKPATKTGSFFGNIRFDKLDKVREDYGIDESIDATITTDQDVSLDQVVGYLSRYYKIVRAIPFDSHNLLIAQRCLLKSSTLTSA